MTGGKALNSQRIKPILSHLAMIEMKTTGLWRTLEIIGGVIAIFLAGVALADYNFAVQTLVIVIASGLIIVGLFRIGVGIYALILPSGLRAFNTAGGIIAVVLGIAALLDLQGAVNVLITILALAILLIGAVEIGVGVARHPPTWLRVTIVALGVLTITLSALVVLDMSIGQGIIAIFLALGLLLIGIRNILHGITGHHPVDAPIAAGVTAA